MRQKILSLSGVVLGAAFMLTGALTWRHAVTTKDTAALVNGKAISKLAVDRLSEALAKEEGKKKLSLEDRRAILESLIDEELLFQMGLRLDSIQNDSIIRRRLIQIVLRDAESAIPAPSAEELLAFFGPRREAYAVPDYVRFSQIYVPALGRSQKEADAIAGRIRKTIGTPDDFLKASRAWKDAFPSHGDEFFYDPPRLRAIYGSDFTRKVLALKKGEISLPISSGIGSHIVRILERKDSYVPPFEHIREIVERDWRAEERKKAHASLLGRLRGEAAIEVLGIDSLPLD